MEAIIFCGIQATGKSSFYKEKFFKSHIRISLDLLNTRNKEQKFINACIAAQQRYVIDNTNVTKELRVKYISEAKASKYKVIGYYFQSKVSDAIERNKHRAGKERIPDIAIKGTYNKLEVPSIDEGFDELYFVEIDNNEFKIKEWIDEI